MVDIPTKIGDFSIVMLVCQRVYYSLGLWWISVIQWVFLISTRPQNNEPMVGIIVKWDTPEIHGWKTKVYQFIILFSLQLSRVFCLTTTLLDTKVAMSGRHGEGEKGEGSWAGCRSAQKMWWTRELSQNRSFTTIYICHQIIDNAKNEKQGVDQGSQF